MTVLDLYNKLYKHYGKQHWWPAKSPFEMIVGAVLTQNTAWSNVVSSIDEFGDNLSPQFIEKADIEEIKLLIKKSGFFNQKAKYLKNITKYLKGYNYSFENIINNCKEALRAELLNIKGIGRETADSILLYAFQKRVFVIDTYTKRLLSRLNITNENNYEMLRAFVEKNLPLDIYIYNEFHALIVKHCKDVCRKKPLCELCLFREECLLKEKK